MIEQIRTAPSLYLARIIALLRQFSTAAAPADYQKLLQKHCHVFIQTRWLSLSCICSYIRMKRNVILDNNYLTACDIMSILRFELLLTPLFELHLFLEREHTKLYEVFPAIMRTLLQYETIMKVKTLWSPDWCYALHIIVHYLIQLTLSGSTGSLIALAFSLTPVGTYLFQQNRFASGFDPTKPILNSAELLFSCFPFSYTFSFIFLGREILH